MSYLNIRWHADWSGQGIYPSCFWLVNNLFYLLSHSCPTKDLVHTAGVTIIVKKYIYIYIYSLVITNTVNLENLWHEPGSRLSTAHKCIVDFTCSKLILSRIWSFGDYCVMGNPMVTFNWKHTSGDDSSVLTSTNRQMISLLLSLPHRSHIFFMCPAPLCLVDITYDRVWHT